MKWIINNLKMNLTLPEMIVYEKQISTLNTKNEIVICPSFPFLPYFHNPTYHLGSQNVSEMEEGSLTGEVSAKQLKSLGVEYVIVGHSERKEKLLETNEQISQKIKQSLNNNIIPILCIGEKENDENNRTQIIEQELEEMLKDVLEIKNMIIAYEPIWAIGTNQTPSISEIQDTILFIKNWIKRKYNQNIRVIYGGSVDENNIVELNKIKELDGYLLGGTSLNVDKLKEMIQKVEEE